MTAETGDDIDIAASYSRRDAAVVVPLLDALKARGIRVWFDKNIPGGALWEETITRFMRRAKAVVFFASRASLESDRCFDEVSAARTLKKPIIPVLVERVNIPDDLPDRLVLTLQTRNTIDAWPGSEGDPVAALVHALAGFGVTARPASEPAASPAQAPTPAPAPAPAAAPPPQAPAPRPSPGRLALYGIAGLGAVALVVLATLMATGTLRLGGPDLPQFSEAEWCSQSAPRLLGRAVQEVGLPALERAADEGDVTAMTLHCLSPNQKCANGEGDNASMSRAFASCQKAGDKGSWRAVFNQGWLKQRGCGVPIDSEGAVAAYQRSADAGCAIAQYTLARLYQDAEIVGFDEPKAIKLLTDAANQNYPPAMNALANAYALGRGVAEDDARAADLYHRAADLGHPGAMYNYAHVLEIGVGVPKNVDAAVTYYRRAAQQDEDKQTKEDAENALKRLAAMGHS